MTEITHAFETKTQMRIARFLLVIGSTFLVLAVWRLYVEVTFVRSATRTLGMVVSVTNSDRVPVVEFAEGNDVVRFTPTSWDAFHRYSVGMKVAVLYAPLDRKNAELDQFLHLWNSTMAFIVGGLLALVFGWLTATGRGSWGPLKQVRFRAEI